MGFTGNQQEGLGFGEKSLEGTEPKLDDEMAMEVCFKWVFTVEGGD